MDRRANAWYLTLPQGVVHRDGYLLDTATNRKCPLNETAQSIVCHLARHGITFRSLVAGLAEEFNAEPATISDEISQFLVALNRRHLVNISEPFGSGWRHIWRMAAGFLTGHPCVWVPSRRFDLVSFWPRWWNVFLVIPLTYLIAAGVVAAAVTVEFLLLFPDPSKMTHAFTLLPAMVVSFLVHEGGHVLTVLLLHKRLCYVVTNHWRMSVVHEAGSLRCEIIIGLAGPSLAVLAGVMILVTLHIAGGTQWTMIALPFQLHAICFFPGMGDSDRLWFALSAGIKRLKRR